MIRWDPEPPGWADFRDYQAWTERQMAALLQVPPAVISGDWAAEPGGAPCAVAGGGGGEYAAGYEAVQVPGVGRVWLRGGQEFTEAMRGQPGRITSALTAAGLIATEEPGRPVLASAGQSRQTRFREADAPLTLARARREWLGGGLALADFIAAVDRAGLAELDRLPDAPWRLPWWKRLLVRVLARIAGRHPV